MIKVASVFFWIFVMCMGFPGPDHDISHKKEAYIFFVVYNSSSWGWIVSRPQFDLEP